MQIQLTITPHDPTTPYHTFPTTFYVCVYKLYSQNIITVYTCINKNIHTRKKLKVSA